MRSPEKLISRYAVAMTAISFLISGCSSGGGGGEEATNDDRAVYTNHELSGSVGDGPVVGATVRILSQDGRELGELQSDASSGYSTTVLTTRSDYPLSLISQGGTDLVTNAAPDFDLLSAVAEAGSRSIANANPFSTFTVELSRNLPGGITSANLSSAETTVARELNFGLTTLATSGAMTTAVTSSNIAEIVRASEALAETVRRTRDAIVASGSPTTANSVVQALSSDLTDGVLDGLGGPLSDARIAATATVVSAQVLLETMANQLYVNGVPGTQAMSDAIDQVLSDAANPTLDELTVTADMLTAARVGLVAAHAVTSDPDVADLLTSLEDVQAGATSTLMRSFVLPADYRNRLVNTVLLVAGGSTAVLGNVNDVSRNRTTTIGSDNRAPTISGTPANSVEAGQAYSFTPTATDPDGDALSFSIANLPTWASFNSSTGQLSGTPAIGDVGGYANIVITVTDGELSSSIGPFSINVYTDNRPPEISGFPPASVGVSESYLFTPTASDPDGDVLTFSIVNRPSWLMFNPENGRLTGTPGPGGLGVYSGISIVVSDGFLTDTLGPFSIEVTGSGGNTPPTISGTPNPEVMVGNAYTFTPTASDADGDPLTFSITGLPAWMSFNTSTGELSGTPQEADVGTYTGITITVSDGAASADLGPFSITVQAISLGSVELTWTAPTLNEDGTALTDLDGYFIYWGTTLGVYTESVRIDNESLTTYVIENLDPGTYYFVATAFNTAGEESQYSGVLTQVVQ